MPSDAVADNPLKSPPKIFTIETTLGCDLRCPECAIGGGAIKRTKGMMSFEQFKVIADKIRPYATYVYLHNWGEPLINPDIFKIISYTAQFAPCNISTNCMSLTREKIEALITSGVSDVIVSIDGVSQEVYEQYRVGGNVDKAFSALAMMRSINSQYGDRVNIIPQFIVFKHNQHEMSQFAQKCAALGLHPSFKAPYIRKKDSRYQYSENSTYQRMRFSDVNQLRVAMTGCPDPREVFTILVDGSVVICCHDFDGATASGNIFSQTVMDIWNSAAFLKYRTDILSGNTPAFCLENCLMWSVEARNNSVSSSSERYQQLLLEKSRMRDEIESRKILHHPMRVEAYRGENLGPRHNKVIDERSCAVQETPILKRNHCVFLNTYYPGFLDKHYKKRPESVFKPYIEQLQTLQFECFGDSDFYSKGLIKAGMYAEDFIINCRELQHTWAREHNCAATGIQLMEKQIQDAAPEVVYIQDLNNTSRDFLEAIRPFVRMIVGQIATPVMGQIPFDCYDVIFSSFPHYVAKFRSAGLTSYYQPLAFDPRVLEKIAVPDYRERPIGCSFVGGISSLHVESYRLLDILAEKTPIEFWGYGAETLPAGSRVHARHHGEAWGKEMFQVIGQSRITVNRHGEVAENYANNMRLFEATGCGALLITDYKDNLQDLFEIGKEVVAYRSPEECAALVNYYLAYPDEAEAIARAGQARTLRDHSYDLRMAQTAEILERHLRYQDEPERLPALDVSQISCGHTIVAESEVTAAMTSAWQNNGIPARQRALVQQELAGMYKGNVAVPFQTLADILQPHTATGCSVLEIGCASGYYYEILEYLLNRRIDYTGVDYSEAMIAMAKDYYPKAKFFVADGANLPFADRKFHTVISSCILLHVPNYRDHILETARVAERFIVASRTPICKRRPTQYLKKFAYGVETVELVFNQNELLELFALNQFQLVHAVEYQAEPSADIYQITYLLKRMS